LRPKLDSFATSSVLQATLGPNNAAEPATEAGERRGPAKGNSPERTTPRTQRRAGVSHALERVRQAAKRDRKQRFTALLHHVYAIERLRAAYEALNPRAAAGIDGETWTHYGQNLEANLRDLSGRLQRGAYRAQPVRRAFIPKADGRQRPLGVPALEDKLVQRAVVEVLNAIADTDFLGFSYGFRPKRSPHDALDALSAGLLTQKVNWVLDADIQSFFDTLEHGWLVRFIEHRVADRRVVRLIQKWLNAGVLADGERTCSEVGTVQGGSISPLLANVYLHYVFDLWVQRWRQTQATGDVIVVRFADDFVVGFQYRHEAERFLAELRVRFASSASRCILTKPASSSSGRMRTGTDEGGVRASRTRSTSWASPTSVGRSGVECSRSCGRRSDSGCGRSCRRSRPNCGGACISPSRNKGPTCARSSAATCGITACP
jgi:RNA-directed DNA polymerase